MRSILLIIVMLGILGTNIYSNNVKLDYLRTENLTTPLGLDINKPKFSWQMQLKDNARGYSQKAYQITVKNESQQEVWNSGKVNSDESINIYYGGADLKPMTRYTWNLTVWDNNNQTAKAQSWFETGFLNPSISAWNNSSWIGGGDEDLVLQSNYLSVYTLKYSIQLDQKSKSTRGAFVFGANDPRLMDRNKNIYEIQNKRNESYILLTLDISPLTNKTNGQAKIDIYRVGYDKNDSKEKPLLSFDIPASIINENNMYETHPITIEVVYGLFDIFIGDKSEENKITKSDAKFDVFNFTDSKVYNLNPVGHGGDFICFPVVGDIGFSTEPNQVAYFSDIQVNNYRTPSNSLFRENINENNYNGIYKNLLNSEFKIDKDKFRIGSKETSFVVADPSRNSTPMLRTTFDIKSKPISKARLYVTARGIYEMYINGSRVGNDYFNPGLTQYDKVHTYQTYDVTPLIKDGKNAIGAMLSEGWWSGAATFIGAVWNYWGDRQSLLAKLVITYNDGSQEIIDSNDTWKYYSDGPIRLGSFYQGEIYDARKEKAIEGWSNASYNDNSWKNAVVQHNDGVHYSNAYDEFVHFAKVESFDHMKLEGSRNPNPQVVDRIVARSLSEPRTGVFIYDMGQNMVGLPQIKVNGKEGDTIVVRYAEILYPNLPEYKDKVGTLMTENLRAAMAQDIYILKGGEETISPRFTLHGYRYVEITGIQEAIPLSDVEGLVISSIHKLTSNYSTSNKDVNRLWQNITWSTLGNFLSIPTDCPQRNERMGWSGDISVFSKTATYLGDINGFLDRHTESMRNTQQKNGRYADIAPLGAGFGGVLWGSAGIIVPWEAYCQYGDKEVLKNHYNSMKEYMVYFGTTIDPITNTSNDGFLGDWLSPTNSRNDNSILFESYYIYELDIMSKVASILGHDDEAKAYQDLRSKRKDFFNKTYLDRNKRTIHSGVIPSSFTITSSTIDLGSDFYKKGNLMDTQASYAVPLGMGIIDDNDKKEFVENFAQTLKRETTDDLGVNRPKYSLLTGFIGTSWISNALSDNGLNEEAYRLLLNNQYPSWLYPVRQGATTIWERLNSYTIENGFGGNNNMNSFNHYSFGSVGAWMVNHSLGIQRDENHPGFKHFILAPVIDPTKKMTYAEGHYDSYYGTIESKWEYSPDFNKVTYTFIVPPNTSATLLLHNLGKVTLPKDKKGIKGDKNSNCKFELQSGRYVITQDIQ